jgi:uncharacterized protein (TIGR03118 family)
MTSWLRRLRHLVRSDRSERKRVAFRPRVDALEDRCLLSAGFVQRNLVSDVPGMAETTDPNLINPWGLAQSAGSPFWISDNNAGVSTLYDGQGNAQSLVVTIPATKAGATGTPTGIVNNADPSAFQVMQNGNSTPSFFLFDTLDGNIEAWSPGANFNKAFIEWTTPGAEYTGLAQATNSGTPLLYAADFAGGKVDVFGGDFKPVTNLPAAAFTDPNVPSDFHPFNIQNINGLLYVTFVQESTDSPPVDNAHAGNGFVDVFKPDGTLVQSLINQTHGNNQHLNSPWGLALAPAGFGDFSGDLLVGNFGDGAINAYDPNNGNFLGTLKTTDGTQFQVDNLWAIRFGTGGAGSNPNTLYFTAGVTDDPTKGPFGASDGLFGALEQTPTLPEAAAIVPNLGQAEQHGISTVPANGDVNPYGVAFVPQGFHSDGGPLQPGDILVSNFNNSQNQQGTGTTIVRITPDGHQSVFFTAPAGSGLTTALGVLKDGIVVVGSLPTKDGTSATIQPGSLIFINSQGKSVLTLPDANGPWDLTVNDQGDRAQLFVSDVLNGTVTRIDLQIHGDHVTASTPLVIASGYGHTTDPSALVIGPTGLAYDARRDVLYVASTLDNEIFAVAHAGATTKKGTGPGQVVFQDPHLRGPLGLVLAPNGDLITANGDSENPDMTNRPPQNGELVEFIPGDVAVGHPMGQFVGQFQLDPNTGSAFGIAVAETDGLLKLAAVNDDTNKLETFTFRLRENPPPPTENGNGDDQGHHDDQGPSLAQIEAEIMAEVLREVEAAIQAHHHHHPAHHHHMM